MKIPKFTAVIHVTSDRQAIEQSKLAIGAGAGGIFLIDHSRPSRRLIESYEEVRQTLPGAWIGLNFLDLDTQDAIDTVPACAQALWVDDGGVDERTETQPRAAWMHKEAKGKKPTVAIFGGVAFKYQSPVENPARVAAMAAPYMDVVTTSGSGTGSAPDPDKIIAMKKAIGTGSLAIASGMSPENVHLFRDHADCLMVATSISKAFNILDEAKVTAMAAAIAA